MNAIRELERKQAEEVDRIRKKEEGNRSDVPGARAWRWIALRIGIPPSGERDLCDLSAGLKAQGARGNVAWRGKCRNEAVNASH